ncbi:hypothetical protein CYMTET_44446 [Cymbomonas tetramitiformis]|uniref:Uncharacterized protein n=1 Tax=Cymbomonas tetramitiformis TaxID=36881 RepID=A0AAE0EZL1_9CHLO|nr:hypothetical protein CYMTET_44446 [Cymbomonas tetramitiformis]
MFVSESPWINGRLGKPLLDKGKQLTWSLIESHVSTCEQNFPESTTFPVKCKLSPAYFSTQWQEYGVDCAEMAVEESFGVHVCRVRLASALTECSSPDEIERRCSIHLHLSEEL